MRQVMIDKEPHRQADRVEPRRNDSAEFARRGLDPVRMKVLRIVSSRELENLPFAHRDASKLVDFPGFVILEEALAGRRGKATERHAAPRSGDRNCEAPRPPPERARFLQTGKHSIRGSNLPPSTHPTTHKTLLHRDRRPPGFRAVLP